MLRNFNLFTLIKKHRFSLLCIFFAVLLLCGCTKPSANKKNDTKIKLDDHIYWIETTEESTIEDILQSSVEFNKLNSFGPKNLNKIVSKNCDYIWLKIPFVIPYSLQEQNLGLVIPRLSFADKAWLNGHFIGDFGSFPPNIFPSKNQCQFFLLPEQVLIKNAPNTIYVKVYNGGSGEISNGIFISSKDSAFYYADNKQFLNSRLYMSFIGGLFCSFLVFFLLYIFGRHYKEYKYFSLMTLFTIPFLTITYVNEIPFLTYLNISYCTFLKFFSHISCYLIVYFYVGFIINFMDIKESKIRYLSRNIILALQIMLTLIAPNYEVLIKIFPISLLLGIYQIIFSCIIVFKALFNPVTKAKAKTLLYVFAVLIFTIFIDLVTHVFLKLSKIPFYTIFGWQITIIGFIILMVTRYAKLYKENAYLTANLKHEVFLKTKDLEVKNKSLEDQKIKSKYDLQMAASVQQKFLPKINNYIKGWNLAVSYTPLEEVSGDFYDFYFKNDDLKGFCIFDVSGHGIPASLVTMLSKHIISNTFFDSLRRNDSCATIMTDINDIIIQEKGDIDNYLTGLLFKINGSSLQLSNAGHPHPILYKAKTNTITEIKPSKDQFQFGAIGMAGIPISFVDIDLKIEKDDILICFTDGLIEAKNEYGSTFDKKAIYQILKDYHSKSSEEILNILLSVQKEFIGSKPIEDDLTIMILKKQ